MSIPDEKSESKGHSRRRRLVFYPVLLLVVLSPLVAVEITARLLAPAVQPTTDDPFIAFSALRPLFVKNKSGSRYEIAAERLVSFRQQSFPAAKPANVFRVFCLGGSTVQGRPYSVETAFSTWLELSLNAAGAGTDYEIVNCGGISYASYRLVPIMREILGHEPDLVIIYMGHNEFLEDRTYAKIRKIPDVLIRLHDILLNLRSYALAYRYVSQRRHTNGHRAGPKTIMSEEVKTMLDLEQGLAAYSSDPAWRQGVIEHFRRNLETMIGLARRAGVPLIIVNPASNVRDCPPFKSQSRSGLPEEQVERVATLRRKAEKVGWSDTYGKLRLLEEAAAIDDRHAGLAYAIGKCYARLGRMDEAKRWLVQAKDLDVCPLRILESMHNIIRELCDEYRVPLVDIKAMMEVESEGGIVGNNWLVDHVHPTIDGHQLIAGALFRRMEQMEFVSVDQHWAARRDSSWAEHLASLDAAYYAQGMERLKRLQQWSRGRIPAEAQQQQE